MQLTVNNTERKEMQDKIPEFISSGQSNGKMFIAMKQVGKNLSDFRKHNPNRVLSEADTRKFGGDILACLQCLHEAGYVHRDIKPVGYCVFG